MPYLGAHMPISDGIESSLYEGKRIGCDVIQIFTHGTTSWYVKSLTEEKIEAFKRARKETGIIPVSVHVVYLINIASSEKRIWRNSVNLLKKEIERTEALDIPYVVMHPGSHKGAGEDKGIENIVRGLKKVIEETSDKVKILLETTAGQGTSIGYRFEQLAEIMEKVDSERIGICVDTCHIFAAGYDFRTKQGYERIINEIEDLIGLEYLLLFHVNDSKKDCGLRIDRHMHIGKGMIGKEAIGFFLKDRRFKNHPFILETPKEDDYDIINLEILRQIIKGDGE